MGRKRKNAGRRCPGHDYRSRCQYHIILNKALGIPDFSHIEGIVNSRLDPPRALNHFYGEIIASAFKELKKCFPFIWIRRRCIMPDHLHFLIFVRETTEYHLGDIIKKFKTLCSDLACQLGTPERLPIFEDGYYDVILKKKDQLKKMLSYISDNPRRWLVRRQFPGWFHHFRLQINGRLYEAFGNWDLLTESEHEAVEIDSGHEEKRGGMAAVKVSSKYTAETLKEKKWGWFYTVKNDGVLVSPFISEAEKKVRDWAMDNDGAIILLRAEPFGERYKPQGRYFELCGEGRLLEVHVPVEGEEEAAYLRREKKPPRAACQRMNHVAQLIAEGKARKAD